MAKEEKQAQGLNEETLGAIRAEVGKAAGSIVQQIQQQLESNKTGLNHLGPAYIAAVKGSRDAVKNATNPHLRNTYADLGSVLDAVRDAFLGNGLWLLQSPGEVTPKEGRPYAAMHGVLIHSSGQSIQFKMELPAFTVESKKNGGGEVLNAQTVGSALSYARRYMWAAVAGITQVDDDGDEASYVDGADGPATTATTAATSTAANDETAMIGRIAAAPTMDALKALRDEAQALAKRLGSKKVTDAYMAARDRFKEPA